MNPSTTHQQPQPAITTIWADADFYLNFSPEGAHCTPAATWPRGGAELVEHAANERQASLARGGTGWFARFSGQMLTCVLPLLGGALVHEKGWTLAMRLNLEAARAGQTIFELHDTASARPMMRLAIEPRVTRTDLFFEMKTTAGSHPAWTPLAYVADTGWHDLLVRYTGKRLDLYVDGRLMHHFGSVGGELALRGPVRITVGGGQGEGEQEFEGALESVAVWHRVLEDEELFALAGGDQVVRKREGEIAGRVEQVARKTAERVKADPQHPKFHFAPEANWMNDPNGLIQWGDEYHLFYQYNPHGAYWGTMHWGHARSRDLVNWEHLPIALRPEPGAPDRDGVFSGCAVNDNGVARLLYTGVFPEVQCLATGSPDLLTWEKDASNPVISGPPVGMKVTGFRDPFLWREGDEWLMALGSGLEGAGGSIPLYASTNLTEWRSLHSLLDGDAQTTGTIWECPNFFPVGQGANAKHLLVISPIPLGKVIFMLGDYVARRFKPESRGLMDEGASFYAPQTFLTRDGRRVMFGWLREERNEALQCASGWSGVQSLPREVGMDDQGRLMQRPAVELLALREAAVCDVSARDYAAGETVAQLPLGQGELELEVPPGEMMKLRLIWVGTEESVALEYDPAQRELVLDRSGLRKVEGINTEAVKMVLGEGIEREALRLRVFLDRSVIEIFVNERECLTARVYPEQADAPVRIMAGEAQRFSRARVWTLRDARLTKLD